MARDGFISVNMGQPQLDVGYDTISREVDLIELPIEGAPGAVGMGNPHCVFVVDDADVVDWLARGRRLKLMSCFRTHKC